MKNIKIIQLSICFDRLLQFTPNLGALTLKRQKRTYILDVIQSYTYGEKDCGDTTEIHCTLKEDKDTFEDCKYDLTKEDLLSEDLIAEFYISSEDEEFEVTEMKLEFEIEGKRQFINVTED